MARPLVSLCMIVRDEAGMIDDCLRSVRGFVSEIIVVDTGSLDDTRERAKRAGAKVFDLAWGDDFSEARNASFRHATGEWLLVLDADERLVGVDARRAHARLKSTDLDVGMLRLHDAVSVDSEYAKVLSGEARMGDFQHVPRLVRNRRSPAYAGVIHEDLAPWIVQTKRRVAAFDLDIVHLGATRQVYQDRNKLERNVRLLRELGRRAPTDPTAFGYLAHQYLENDRIQEAFEATEEGWRRLPHVESTSGYRPSILRLADARAQIALRVGDFRTALDTVLRAQRIEGPHVDLEHIAGLALERLASSERSSVARERYLRRAEACLRSCLRPGRPVPWMTFVAGALGWASWNRLGSVLLARRQFAPALDAYTNALTLRPGLVEARLGSLEATVRLRGGQAAMPLVAQGVGDAELRTTPDLWVLAALACESMGALDDMARFLGEARAQRPSYVSPSRRLLHAEQVAAMALYRGAPVAAPGLVGAIGALASRAAVSPDDGGAAPSDRDTVNVLVRNLARLGRLQLLSPALEPRAEWLAPGLPDDIRAAAASVGVTLAPPSPRPSLIVRGADARFVGALLDAHPRLRGRVTVDDLTGQEIGATILQQGSAASDGELTRIVMTSRDVILRGPVGECDRVLAHLGEGGVGPMVRHLVEAYTRTAPESHVATSTVTKAA